MTAKRVIASGRVQGVFFRDSAKREARSRGVTGWVRNREDGTVEAHFEGDEDAVAAMVEWARGGPPRAEVTDFEVDVAESEGLAEFEVR
jgi:acylphosphatase